MQENKENPNELLELLLEKCDRLYQENMLLKGKLEDRTQLCRSLTSGGADDKQVRESPALLPPDTDDETDGCQSATTHGQ